MPTVHSSLEIRNTYFALLFLSPLIVSSGCGGGGSDPEPAPRSSDDTELVVTSSVIGIGGTIEPSSLTLTVGMSGEFILYPDQDYRVGAVSGCGGTLQGTTYVVRSIDNSCEVTATFVESTAPSFTVTSSFDETKGALIPSEITAELGANLDFEIVLEPGYQLDGASGCGGYLVSSGENVYRIDTLTEDCIVSLTFSSETGPVDPQPPTSSGDFVDFSRTPDYLESAMGWDIPTFDEVDELLKIHSPPGIDKDSIEGLWLVYSEASYLYSDSGPESVFDKTIHPLQLLLIHIELTSDGNYYIGECSLTPGLHRPPIDNDLYRFELPLEISEFGTKKIATISWGEWASLVSTGSWRVFDDREMGAEDARLLPVTIEFVDNALMEFQSQFGYTSNDDGDTLAVTTRTRGRKLHHDPMATVGRIVWDDYPEDIKLVNCVSMRNEHVYIDISGGPIKSKSLINEFFFEVDAWSKSPNDVVSDIDDVFRSSATLLITGSLGQTNSGGDLSYKESELAVLNGVRFDHLDRFDESFFVSASAEQSAEQPGNLGSVLEKMVFDPVFISPLNFQIPMKMPTFSYGFFEDEGERTGRMEINFQLVD